MVITAQWPVRRTDSARARGGLTHILIDLQRPDLPVL
jgi:hypothetical protein